MNNSSHTGLFQSANSSTSTLRPRAARLISYVDDENTDNPIAVSSSTPPCFPSRGVSPNNTTVTRSKSTDKPRHGGSSKPHIRSSSGSRSPAAGSQGLWDSWSSIQGLASSLLGNDVPGSAKDKTAGSFKTPLWMKQDKLYGSKLPSQQWGPSYASTSNPALEATEERQAMVQAKRREALLLASVSENRDKLGRFKRRDSDPDLAVGTTPTGSSEDALVYIHKVQKGDTLAGVIIKYNCQAQLFRKVNRFWPNDNIQTRTHVLIPLEGSTTRGRKVDSPYVSQDLFDPGLDHGNMQSTSTSNPPNNRLLPANGAYSSSNLDQTISSSALTSEPLSLITSLSEEITIKHDSWVQLPNFTDTVEVLRVPRRALGYFPRARRKSNTTLTDASTASTPKTSFDMLRHPPTHAAQTSASLNASPVRRPIPPRLTSDVRQRSSSVAGGSGNTFADALRGPGGVGTLRGLRTEVSRPGPADDPLNRKFAQYLPDLLAPPEDTMMRPSSSLGSSLRPAARATPRASSDSVRSNRSNSNSSGLGDVGGAIEGWVRKMALAGGKREKGRGNGIDRMGDLIELETNTETLQADVRSRESGEEASTPTAARKTASSSATDEALLNERFPIRGRVRNAYASSAGSSTGKDKDD